MGPAKEGEHPPRRPRLSHSFIHGAREKKRTSESCISRALELKGNEATMLRVSVAFLVAIDTATGFALPPVSSPSRHSSAMRLQMTTNMGSSVSRREMLRSCASSALLGERALQAGGGCVARLHVSSGLCAYQMLAYAFASVREQSRIVVQSADAAARSVADVSSNWDQEA